MPALNSVVTAVYGEYVLWTNTSNFCPGVSFADAALLIRGGAGFTWETGAGPAAATTVGAVCGGQGDAFGAGEFAASSCAIPGAIEAQTSTTGTSNFPKSGITALKTTRWAIF